MPIRFISVATWQRPIFTPSVFEIAQHPAAREQENEIQLVHPAMMARTTAARLAASSRCRSG